MKAISKIRYLCVVIKYDGVASQLRGKLKRREDGLCPWIYFYKEKQIMSRQSDARHNFPWQHDIVNCNFITRVRRRMSRRRVLRPSLNCFYFFFHLHEAHNNNKNNNNTRARARVLSPSANHIPRAAAIAESIRVQLHVHTRTYAYSTYYVPTRLSHTHTHTRAHNIYARTGRRKTTAADDDDDIPLSSQKYVLPPPPRSKQRIGTRSASRSFSLPPEAAGRR